MIWLRQCAFALLLAALHVSRTEGRLIQQQQNAVPQTSRRLKGGSNDKIGNNKKFADGKNMALEEQQEFIPSDVCSIMEEVTLGSLFQGNHEEDGSIDQGTAPDCIDTELPGKFFSVNGTGDVFRAAVIEGNYTRIAVFKETACDDNITCGNFISPVISVAPARESSAWTAFWNTRADESYLIYLYGSGHFQMILTEQGRPENDQTSTAIALEIGDSIEGSTTYATPYDIVGPCGSSSNNATPSVWYSVDGTGLPLQAHLKTVSEGFVTQISVYSTSLKCLARFDRVQYFDPDSPQRYAISNGLVWSSNQGDTYYIRVLGRTDESPGVSESGGFELTIQESTRPVNDNCQAALNLPVGTTMQSTTSFATLDETYVCSPVTLGEKPTSPGVWYIVTKVEGQMEAKVVSAYSSRVSVFTGDSCDDLVCIEGTVNVSPDATDLVATNSGSVQWNAQSNEVYYILIFGSDAFVGMFDLSLSQVSSATSTPADLSSSAPQETSRPKPGGDDSASATVTPTSTLWEVETSASLSFGFFPGSEVRAPTKDESDALVVEISHFFSKVFRNAFDDAFIRFETEDYVANFSDESALPVVINFQAKAYFTSEDAAPSATEVFNLMESADFQDFIRNYAWQLEPFGATLFFQTLRVVFAEAALDPSSGGMNELSGSQAESVQRVSAKAKMLFSFFPEAEIRAPTPEEVEGLLSQTRVFFSKALDAKFDDYIRFGAIVTGTNYTEDNQRPVEISLDVYVFFELADIGGNQAEIHTSDQIVMAMEDAELTDFIQNYVWESEPFAENIFYETMHVQVMPDGFNISSTELVPAAPAVPAVPLVVHSGNTAAFNIALSYSFHDTATVTLREPTKEEIDGLLIKTTQFFIELLESELPETILFGRLKMNATSVDYNEGRKFAVVIVARVEATYHDGSDVSSRATLEQMIALMETANMNDYVEYYVWNAAPVGNIFFATDQAILEPSVSAPSGTVAPATGFGSSSTGDVVFVSDATPEPAELVPVETDVAVEFFFFEPATRVATTNELGALTTQTQAFFTKALEATYDDLIRLDLDLVTAGFAPMAGNQKAIVSWKVNAVFYVLDGSGAARTPAHVSNILTTSDIEDYVHNYAWSSKPMGINIFFNTSAAEFADLASQTGSEAVAMPTQAPTTTPETSQVIVRASILYGFLEDIVITREPTSNEQEGILFQTSLFFNNLFRQQFPDSFKVANASIKDVTFIGGNNLPISISYEFLVHFNDGSFVPSSDDLYEVMASADFESYIEFFVWNANQSADSMFFDTQHVLFQATM